ncbi:MAG: RNA polymerase sigma factor [Thermoleophilia bacterium]|nr:RNA polymerase sigma factor [Thermoleophilia bacterium]
MRRDSDADAILASRRDAPAFAVLFERHFDAIHGYLRRRVGTDVADELAAETFVQAFASRGRYDRRRPDALPWLYGIAHNLLRHHYRTEERVLRAYARYGVDSSSADANAYSDRDVAAALAELPVHERDVLLLFVWAELSYDEIAVALGLPVGTVRSRLSRGRTRLRELLGGSGQYDDEKELVDG